MPGDPAEPLVVDLDLAGLHSSLEDPALRSMNFLNEVAERYPEAVSFAPGRPSEQFFDIESLHHHLRRFCRYLSDELGYSEGHVRRILCQYGRTSGIVHDLIARSLTLDEHINVDPESIVVTVGCQEAIFLVLRALRSSDRDAVLAVSPTYVGLTGAARLVDLRVLPVSSGSTGVDLADLADQLRRAREQGLRPRACYVMPDFANPSGVSLDLPTRREMLGIAEREHILLLEDNPYGLFNSEAAPTPTLKALDTRRRVIYLGSFAKTVLPGARVGYVLADQRVMDDQGRTSLLAEQLSKIKSMITVNTSPITQAVVGGKLLEHGCSLRRANSRERELYRRNLDQIVGGIQARFADHEDVSWNVPVGGFFLVVTVPFDVNDDLLELSARKHGVLWTPMRHFYGGTGGGNQLRLSCSSLNSEQIDEGLNRLAGFFADQGVHSGPRTTTRS
ncbi:MAG: PLP-dependent aminotransferase family protein [Pseudonocardiaceae bacterium]